MDLNLPEKLSGYTQKQSDFLIAMLDGGIISEAAKKADISEATAHKWLNNGLDKELRTIRANIIEKHLNKLQLASGLAVQTLIDILEDKNTSAGSKLKASTIILGTTMKIREQEEILNRLEALEEQVEEKDNEDG